MGRIRPYFLCSGSTFSVDKIRAFSASFPFTTVVDLRACSLCFHTFRCVLYVFLVVLRLRILVWRKDQGQGITLSLLADSPVTPQPPS